MIGWIVKPTSRSGWRGHPHPDVVDRDPGVVEPTHRVGDRASALGDRDAHRAVLDERARAGDRGQGRHRLIAALAVAEVDLQAVPTDLRLQLVGGSLGDYEPAVDHRDPLGEPVRLVQVLGGEQHSRASRDEGLHGLPESEAAADVQAGCRLVEEEHRRPRDKRGGKIEAAAHASGVGADQPVSGLGEVEVGEELAGPCRSGSTAEVVEAADHFEVLEAGQVLVDGRVLAGEADVLTDPRRVADDVEARNARRTLVGQEQRGEDPNCGRLAGAVRT
jgi:hypothetical protein